MNLELRALLGLACAARTGRLGDKKWVRQMKLGKLDPARLIQLARFHGIAGLAEQGAALGAPGIVKNALGMAADLSQAFTVKTFKAYERLVQTFTEAGIRAVPIQGIAMIQKGLYGSQRLRPLSDMDISKYPLFNLAATSVCLLGTVSLNFSP